MQILGWSVALLTAALLASVVVVHVVLMHRADARISDELAHEADEFAALRARTSSSAAVSALLRTATQRAVPESDIVLFTVRNGRVLSVSSHRSITWLGVRATDVAKLTRVTRTERGIVHLRGGDARYLAVPAGAGRPGDRGTFVAAVLTTQEYASVSRVTFLQLEVGAAALLLASVLAWLIAGRVLRPIRATTELAQRITDTDLSGRLPVGGNDEVGRMAQTFNAMLDRLDATFAAQRRFLAEAGHELRTPITIIQGNLDTLTTADAEDEETLAVVAEELARMSRLVDELALLAASERPDFLKLEPTDLARLGGSLAAKVQSLGGFVVQVEPSFVGTAVLDAQRVTQAIVQLAQNAKTHAPAATPAEICLRTTPENVEFEVRDHGPGIPATERERVFRRFVRLEGRNERSTGLGLAIVAAIATAHGGAVEVSDTAGGGATFALRVPSRSAPVMTGRGSTPGRSEANT